MRVYLGHIHCYDEEKNKFSLVDGYSILAKQILYTAVSGAGNLLAFSRNKTVETQGGATLFTEEIKVEKLGGKVVASLLWSSTTTNLDQFPVSVFLVLPM